jgi:hypothetical protein
VNDQGNTGTDPGLTGDGSSEEHSASVLINVTAVNDAPVFVGLDNNPTFIEGGAPVILDNNVTFNDVELQAGVDSYNGVTLILNRNGGANVEDVFSATGNLSPLNEGGNLVLNGLNVGTVITNSAGTLVIEFDNNATTSIVNEVLQSIAYSNTSNIPPASVQINWNMEDSNNGAQGSGGNLFTNGSTIVNITSVNDAPIKY